MENCIVCGKDMRTDCDVCGNCAEFLKCKHPARYEEKVKEFRKLNKEIFSSNRVKCSGGKTKK